MSENNKPSTKPDNTPELDWLDETIPVSLRFDDPYYSKNDGLAETRHVFINGNRLTDRMQSSASFLVGELGFGTGLNFLMAVNEWQSHGAVDAKFEFISFERYPMSASDMQRALSVWPHISDEAQQLVQAYQEALAGATDTLTINWSDTCKLTVLVGEAYERLSRSHIIADAWFLDGFSPAKNPDMWSDVLMQQVFEHTAPGGTFATYTAAGWVRRNLLAVGFEVDRVPGHAGKREMMIGHKPE